MNCAKDCGACQCQPNKKETSTVGCPACGQKERTCQADGKWGAFGACFNQCAGTQVCHNGACVACIPGTEQTQPCSCGTQRRTCSANGTWPGYGACETTCTGNFSCISGRCGRTYTAYSSAGGAECGYTYSGSTKRYQYCAPGDYCTSSGGRTCRTYQQYQAGDSYHAYSTGGGAQCGYTYSGTVKRYHYCVCGDSCASSGARLCRYSGTACGATYNSCASVAGPECGYIYSGTIKRYQYCKGGDTCSSSGARQCRVSTTCGAGSQYTAFSSAGGPQCGYIYSGTIKRYQYCFGGDTCASSGARLCRR